MLYGHVITHVKIFVDLYCGLFENFSHFLLIKGIFLSVENILLLCFHAEKTTTIVTSLT